MILLKYKLAMKLKLAVVTGSRSEYGLLKPLMEVIKAHKSAQLQLVITGMHLSPEFGLTYKEIEAAGFTINERVEMLLSADTDSAIVKSTAIGMIGMSGVIERLQPDWLIVLGDRFETFAAVFAAHQAKIPIAHLHGGELTEGATDDAMRHAITKMSFLHFTSTDVYRRRVIQLGESPNRVFNVGAIGLDAIRRLKLLSKKELERRLELSLGNMIFLVTYHPVTMERNTAASQVKQILKAFDKFPDAQVIVTMPNADADGRVIMNLFEQYAKKAPSRVKLFTSLGQLKYLSLLKFARLVVGNSSSGIIEAPEMKIPTVNIGNRQEGRVKAKSIIDCDTDADSIVKAIKKALSPNFRKKCLVVSNPYKKEGTVKAILNTIRKVGKPASTKKIFYDLHK
jgi:UDP-hydrolysing UDP-N-acetyl-D-glucosamine 2-epimerase